MFMNMHVYEYAIIHVLISWNFNIEHIMIVNKFVYLRDL